MKLPVKMTINGQTVSHEVEPRTLLVHYIRENVGLTGTHVGCDTSQCGACTILMNGQAVKACNLFAVQVDGADIMTIEGLAKNGELHPIQQGFWEKHGLQCGFCTPGMILSAYQMLERYPKPSEEQIRHQLEGNLCRCTGYHNIVKAIQWPPTRWPRNSLASRGTAGGEGLASEASDLKVWRAAGRPGAGASASEASERKTRLSYGHRD